MDNFDKKTFKVSRGFTYTYYTSPGNRNLPALLFQHGWPDQAAMWAGIASRLIDLDFPIVIPDMLGYAGSSKPTDPSAYTWNALTSDLIEILDAEGVGNVISVGHDWGSAAASRLYHYYTSRVVGLVNLNAAYMTPGRASWDLEALNSATEKEFGYPFFSYWSVFAAADGPAILKENVERLYHVMHGEGETMKKYFCGKNAMREYLTNGGEEIKLRAYAQDEGFKKEFIERFTRDGFEAPQCWYVAMNEDFQHKVDKHLPAAVDKVNVPALYIGAKDDAVCRPEAADALVEQGLLPDYTTTGLIDASHWVPCEKPEEVVVRLRPWLQQKFLQ